MVTPLGIDNNETKIADDVNAPVQPVPPRRRTYFNRPRPLTRLYRVDPDAKPVNGWKIGDQVRVVRPSPSFAEAAAWPAHLDETRRIFQNIVGKMLRIDGFDFGELRLRVFDDGSQAPGYLYYAHTIWLEPECVVLARRSPLLQHTYERRFEDEEPRRLVTCHERRFERRPHHGARKNQVRKFGSRKSAASW